MVGPELGSLNASQFFSVRRDGDRFVAQGMPEVLIGHRLPATSGERADGAYLTWRWDGQRLVVRNDRYGLLPAYYALGPNSFTISTAIEALIADGVPTDIDDDALAVFLRLGTFLGDDTPFVAIRRLPPGTDYVWSGQEERPDGEVALGAAEHGLSHDEACQRYAELFRRALTRRLPLAAEAALALSGGMDSRHILLELCRAGHKPRLAVTARIFPGSASPDVELAESVCRQAGVPHVTLDEGHDWLETERRKNRLTSLCTLEHGWGLPVSDYLRQKTRVVFDGLGGDVFTDCRGITTRSRIEAFAAGRFGDLADDFLGPATGRLAFIAPALRGRWSRERAIERLSTECARFASAPNPPAAFWFWNRTRRSVALLPFSVWQRGLHVITPYMDSELFDFMIGLPAELVSDYTLHAATIRREYPDYAHLPFFSQATPLPADAWRLQRAKARATLRWLLGQGTARHLARGFVLTRLARAQIDRRYSESIGWLPPQVLYLTQLCQLAERRTMNGETPRGQLLGAEGFCAAMNIAGLEPFLR